MVLLSLILPSPLHLLRPFISFSGTTFPVSFFTFSPIPPPLDTAPLPTLQFTSLVVLSSFPTLPLISICFAPLHSPEFGTCLSSSTSSLASRCLGPCEILPRRWGKDMGVIKAVIERGLRRTPRVMYFNPHPQLTDAKTEAQRAIAVAPESHCWRQQLAGGRGREEMRGEKTEGEGRSVPLVPSYLPGLPCFHLPCWEECWILGAAGPGHASCWHGLRWPHPLSARCFSYGCLARGSQPALSFQWLLVTSELPASLTPKSKPEPLSSRNATPQFSP